MSRLLPVDRLLSIPSSAVALAVMLFAVPVLLGLAALTDPAWNMLGVS